MLKWTGEGKLYLHILVLDFLLIAGIIFKNFNFADYAASPHLSTDQYQAIMGLLIVGLVFFLWTLMRGRAQKVKGFRNISIFGFLLVLGGIGLIALMLLYDDLIGSGGGNVGYRAQLLIVMGALASVGGSIIYTIINFPIKRQEELFKQAVHEEIKEFIKASKTQPRVRQSRRQTPPPPRRPSSKAVEVEPLEEGKPAGGAEVVTCDSCGTRLKVPMGRRPVAIRCTKCNSIQVVG